MEPGLAARRASRTLSRIRSLCPPCVLWAVVRTWFNGWCTLRRFQARQRHSCFLSSTCSGEDSIEHYLRCPIVHAVAAKKLRLLHLRRRPGDMLLLDGGYYDDSQLALTAVLLYAAYTSTNQLRHKDQRISEAEGEKVVWCAVRKAGLQSRRLSGIINRIWVT